MKQKGIKKTKNLILTSRKLLEGAKKIAITHGNIGLSKCKPAILGATMTIKAMMIPASVEIKFALMVGHNDCLNVIFIEYAISNPSRIIIGIIESTCIGQIITSTGIMEFA